MASEQIAKVTLAEKEAARIEKDARVKADKIMEEAHKTALADRIRILGKAQKEIEALRASFHTQDKEYRSEISLTAEKSANELRGKTASNRAAAVSAAVDSIIGKA